jgi:hypothetical protein
MRYFLFKALLQHSGDRSGATELVSEKGRANCKYHQRSFVIGLVQTNKLAFLWQEVQRKNDLSTFELLNRKEWDIVFYSIQF